MLVWRGGAWSGPANTLLAQSPFGATTGVAILEEELTALSGASVISTIVIPDRANVLGVSTRNITTITGATSFDCGDGTTANKFGGTLGIAAGSTNVGSAGSVAYYAPTPIVLTANGGNFTAGAVRVAIQYMTLAAPGLAVAAVHRPRDHVQPRRLCPAGCFWRGRHHDGHAARADWVMG